MTTPPRPAARPVRARWSRRRGVGIAAVIIVLAAVNLAVLGAVRTTADDAYAGSLRVETTRAFYAAESAARIAVRCAMDSEPYPVAGSTISIGVASAQYVQVPSSGFTGYVVVQGRSGNGVRRLSINIQDSN